MSAILPKYWTQPTLFWIKLYNYKKNQLFFIKCILSYSTINLVYKSSLIDVRVETSYYSFIQEIQPFTILYLEQLINVILSVIFSISYEKYHLPPIKCDYIDFEMLMLQNENITNCYWVLTKVIVTFYQK